MHPQLQNKNLWISRTYQNLQIVFEKFNFLGTKFGDNCISMVIRNWTDKCEQEIIQIQVNYHVLYLTVSV